MNIKRLSIVVIALILLTLALPMPVQALATSQGLLGVSWNHDSVTVYVSLQKGVDPSYKNQVVTAFGNWSSALKTKSGNAGAFNFTFLTEEPSKKNPADITVTIRRNTGNVLGSTSVSSKGGIIQTVKITLIAYNAMGLPLGLEDFRTIARHEISHALGLGHSNDDGQLDLDLMSPTLDFVSVNYDIYPSELNLAALISIYGNDGFGTPNTYPIPRIYPYP